MANALFEPTPTSLTVDRLLYSALGGAVIIFGARRRGLLGLAIAAAGGRLLAHGLGRRPAIAARPQPAHFDVGLRRGELDAAAAARLRV